MQKTLVSAPVRVTLLYTLVTSLTLFGMSLFIYYFAHEFSSEDFYKRLEIRAALIAYQHFPEDESAKNMAASLRNEYLERLPQEKDYIINVDSAGNFTIPADLNMPGSFFKKILAKGAATEKNNKIYASGLLHRKTDQHVILVVSARNDYIDHQLATLRNILIIGVILSTFIFFILGLIFSKQIFLPIKRMTAKVQKIGSENLHLRLNVSSRGDEVSELARTFNLMLNRLETSFESQNNFVSNASHELGTPLTAIIGEAELALQKERHPEVYQNAMRVILRESERLKAITQSLLNLAQTGFDGKKQIMELLRVDELIETCISEAGRIYPDNKVHIDYSLFPEDADRLNIMGNKNLLTLAFTNIILNGCKYSDNKEVIVSLAASNSKVFIYVKDFGIGIPSGELSYIYDPFFRASNTGSIKGYGIGLPLARNIFRIHDGDILVSSEETKGTEVKVTLPSTLT